MGARTLQPPPPDPEPGSPEWEAQCREAHEGENGWQAYEQWFAMKRAEAEALGFELVPLAGRADGPLESRPRRQRRRKQPIPPAPELSTLPRVTSGPRKGEHWMTKRQFAGWCIVRVATVSDWIHTGRIQTMKCGIRRQSRVLIASGERERRKPPVVSRKRKAP